MNNKFPMLFVIAGPTASGKTSCAVELAEFLKCPVISADSRQVYKEMNIGVARPTVEELSRVKHYFIADRSIMDTFNAGIFEKEVLELLKELFKKHPVVIACGGSGLFIKALIEGFDEIPPHDKSLRDELNKGFQKEGIVYLQHKLKETDPEFFHLAETANPQRLMRSIETAMLTGKSNIEIRKGEKATRDFKTKGVVLDIPRQELYERINTRVDLMIKEGLEEEVRSLLPFKDLPQLRTVGYREWFDYFDGKEGKEEVIEKIKQHTRNYAKRQLTWFRNQTDFEWVNPLKVKDLFD